MLRNLDVRAILAFKNASRNATIFDGFGAVSTAAANNAKKHHSIYATAEQLPIPANIDIAESTRFSASRTRDITANHLLSHYSSSQAAASFDITTDNSRDPHVESYDCGMNAISLNSAMQSNVPTPFGGMHKFSHLNMPGGGWSGQDKFLSHQLNSAHYMALRDQVRADWQTPYADQAPATMPPPKAAACSRSILTACTLPTVVAPLPAACPTRRMYSTKANASGKPTDSSAEQQQDDKAAAAVPTLNRKEQLKRAFREYGATVVIFHVAISLVSLGCFYALVSGGIDVLALLDYVGVSSSVLSGKVAAGASTFVVAYAIHKVFAPVRISITLGATPFIVRYLRSKGILKVAAKKKAT